MHDNTFRVVLSYSLYGQEILKLLNTYIKMRDEKMKRFNMAVDFLEEDEKIDQFNRHLIDCADDVLSRGPNYMSKLMDMAVQYDAEYERRIQMLKSHRDHTYNFSRIKTDMDAKYDTEDERMVQLMAKHADAPFYELTRIVEKHPYYYDFSLVKRMERLIEEEAKIMSSSFSIHTHLGIHYGSRKYHTERMSITPHTTLIQWEMKEDGSSEKKTITIMNKQSLKFIKPSKDQMTAISYDMKCVIYMCSIKLTEEKFDQLVADTNVDKELFIDSLMRHYLKDQFKTEKTENTVVYLVLQSNTSNKQVVSLINYLSRSFPTPADDEKLIAASLKIKYDVQRITVIGATEKRFIYLMNKYHIVITDLMNYLLKCYYGNYYKMVMKHGLGFNSTVSDFFDCIGQDFVDGIVKNNPTDELRLKGLLKYYNAKKHMAELEVLTLDEKIEFISNEIVDAITKFRVSEHGLHPSNLIHSLIKQSMARYSSHARDLFGIDTFMLSEQSIYIEPPSEKLFYK